MAKSTKKVTAAKKTTGTKSNRAKESPKTKRTSKKSTSEAKRKTTVSTASKTRSPRAAATKKTAGEREVTVDRRRGDRRTKSESTAADCRKLERRAKVTRRRQIDPTTCERDYSEDEVEFMNALDDYKRTSGRMFPTCSEMLEVIRGLGYAKMPACQAGSSDIPEEAAQDVNDGSDSAASDETSRDLIDEDAYETEEVLV